MMLTTERLELRSFVLGDAAAVHAYGADPHVTQFMDWGPNTWDTTLDFLASATSPANASVDVAITERSTSEVIGAVGARPVEDGVWEMGYVLRRDRWGHGFATEAAGAFLHYVSGLDGVQTVQARCRPKNTESARVMEKLGMTYVRLIERDQEVRGEWVDSLLYAVTTASVRAGEVAAKAGR